jgi:hypothetical protein
MDESVRERSEAVRDRNGISWRENHSRSDRQHSLIRWLVKTAMVNEFTSQPDEQKYFTEAESR